MPQDSKNEFAQGLLDMPCNNMPCKKIINETERIGTLFFSPGQKAACVRQMNCPSTVIRSGILLPNLFTEKSLRSCFRKNHLFTIPLEEKGRFFFQRPLLSNSCLCPFRQPYCQAQTGPNPSVVRPGFRLDRLSRSNIPAFGRLHARAKCSKRSN